MATTQPPTSIAAVSTPRLASFANAGRAAWAVAALLVLGLTVLGIPAHYDELLGFAENNQRALADLGVSRDTYAGYISGLGIAVVVVHVLIAAVIIARRPEDWMAQFVAFALLANGLINPLSPLHDLAESRGAVRFPADLAVYVGVVSSMALLYLFPNGRFVPRWTLFAALAWAALALPAVFFPDALLSFVDWPTPVLVVVLVIVAASGASAQIYRYANVSSPEQRQQAKWAVLGLMAAIIGPFAFFLPFGSLSTLGDSATPNLAYQRLGSEFFTFAIVIRLITITAFTSALLLFPLSFAIAVLRYRLWDIGVVVNRTLVYLAVTGSLALFYFLSDVVLQAGFRAVTGQERNIVIVISTLAIAALFGPVRRRAQRFIDRRFYRERYDAAQTLAAFSETIRDEVDIERLSHELVAAIEETMQPEHASLWIIQAKSTPSSEA